MDEKQNPWSLANIWNKSLEQKEQRPTEPRDRMWASELSKSDIDIYLKLMGVEPSNKPDNRAKRKFEAGNIWEWALKIVLIKLGVYRATQIPVKFALPNCIEVSGKLDFIAGGKPNYDSGLKELEDIDVEGIFKIAAENFMAYARTNYPAGLDEKILEIKTVGSFGFEKVLKTGKALSGHDLQAFHYAHGLQKESSIVYYSRDDARMVEIPILPNDQRLLEKYTEKVERVSKYYRDGIQPSREPLILFDEDMGKFSRNFMVQYSSYLTMLYGFEDQAAYEEAFSTITSRWNRVLGRVSRGEKMTDNNKEAIEEMRSNGFNPEEIISTIKMVNPNNLNITPQII